MSDTPRTDAKYRETLDGDCLPGCDSHAHEPMCPYCNPETVMAEFARQLECELNAIGRRLSMAERIIEEATKISGAEPGRLIARIISMKDNIALLRKAKENK